MRALSSLLLALCLATLVPACGGGDDDMSPAPDARATSDGAACMGGTPYMDTCASNEQCDTCLCFTYNMGEMRCTQPCTTDMDCPSPSPGCGGMGVCKRPGG